jgi:hypothetical protein
MYQQKSIRFGRKTLKIVNPFINHIHIEHNQFKS